MASVNRLAIRGVRSFAPNEEEQVVEFFFPFTVIAGANGCGKTTIIEALKYSITGALPPGGSKAGQNFVHDPRAAEQSTVKAQVKLRFTSRSGQTMVVVRSMEVTQKKTTASFKQLDGALRTHDDVTGKRVTLSHKCGELDKQLPSLLGISKAILDHVIFCHQEDSSWPLSENMVLKKRFDEIFDSTRYSKAIGIFKQTEKDMNAKVKDLKAEIAGLKSHQHAAHGFRKELAEANESIEELDDEKKRIDKELTGLDEQIQDLSDIVSNVGIVEAELDSAHQKKQNQLAMVTRYREMLEKDLTGQYTQRELEKKLREYDSQVTNQKEELEELQERDQAIDKEIQRWREKEAELTTEKARLDAEKEGYEKNCRERFLMMESVAQTYSMEMSQTGGGGGVNLSMDQSFVASQNTAVTGGTQESMAFQITSDDMEAYMKSLEKKENELKRLLTETTDRHQAEGDRLYNELADLRAQRKSIEAEREKINQARRDDQAELKELSRRMEAPVRIRKGDVEEVRRRVEKLVKQRDQASADPRREEIPTEIRRLEEKVDSIKRQIDDDRIALDGLRLCADAENQITMLREQCTKEVELLEETIRENSFSLQKFNIQPSEKLPSYDDDDGRALVTFVEAIVDKIQAEYSKAKSELDKAETDVNQTQRTVNEMTATCSSKQQSLQSISSRMEAMKGGPVAKVEATIEKLRELEQSEGLEPPAKNCSAEDAVTYIDGRLKTLEDESPLDDQEYSKKLLRKLRKLAKKKGDDGKEFRCPCCTRAMDDDEYRTFKEKFEELMEESVLVSADQESTDRYNSLKKKYEKWVKVLRNNLVEIREYERLQKECSTAETEVQQLRDDLSTQQTCLSELKTKSANRRNEVDEIRELVEISKRWADDAHRIKDKRIQINHKKDELSMSTAVSGRDLRTVEKELNSKIESKEEKINAINRLNKEMTELNNRVTQLSSQASQNESLLREKEAKFAEGEKATERKNELHLRLQKAKEEDTQLQDQLAPINRRIETKTREQERNRSLRESEVQERQTALYDFQAEVKELRRLTNVIESFLASGKLQQLEDHAVKVDEVLQKIETKRLAKQELAPQLAKAAASVENQEREKKLLRDNIDLITEEEKIKTIDEDIEKLTHEMNTIEGADEAGEKLREAEATKQKRLGEKARIEGRWMEVVEKMRSLKRKLSTEEYKNVDEEYRVANIKFSTTEMAAKDIKKYYNAVEQALLQYHNVKIKEINKIIQELWLLTYKGEDINSIQIESGHETGSGAKKTYNYRVVMTKNGSEPLDMRGRCSAGQRVLACIVIRLALAETFGVNCGCIALDEPTVNLDYRNKKGLAVALSQIIAARSQQSNFQLIMITHDEEFVSMMKTELAAHSNFSMPEKFFRVHREMGQGGKYFSKITATDWEEIV